MCAYFAAQWSAFLSDEGGSAVLEYAVILALFGLVAVAGLRGVSQAADGQFLKTETNLTAHGITPP